MKYTLLFLLPLLFVFACKKKDSEPKPTQSTSVIGKHVYPGDISGAVMCMDGAIAVCGTSATGGAMMAKLSASGTLLWTKEYSVDEVDYLSGIAETTDGQFMLVGEKEINGNPNIAVLRVGSSGNVIWMRDYGGADEDYSDKIIRTHDNNFVISGTSYSFTSESFCDIYMVKINGNGDEVWSRNFTDPEQEDAFSLIETTDHAYVITGTNEDDGSGVREMYMLKVDGSGNKIWDSKIPHAGGWKWGYSTIELNNGELVSCGHQYPGSSGAFILKTSASGQVIWNHVFNAPDSSSGQQGNAIVSDGNNGYTVAGYTRNPAMQLPETPVLFSAADDGTQLWRHEYTVSSDERADFLFRLNSGEYIILGNAWRSDQFFIMGTDANGDQ